MVDTQNAAPGPLNGTGTSAGGHALKTEVDLEHNASFNLPVTAEKQDFIVEFDGPDDPLHPQCWNMKTKYVHPYLYLVYSSLY